MTEIKPKAKMQPLSLKKLDAKIVQSSQDSAKVQQHMESVEDKVDNLTKSLQEFMKTMQSVASPNSTRAADNRHIVPKQGVDVDKVYQHLDEHEIEFTEADENGDIETTRPGLREVASHEFKTKAEQTAFDLEKIQIMVMPSQAVYPDHTFCVGVNGRMVLIIRGKRQWLPRAYVEVLLRAKVSTYGNFEVRNNVTNELEIKNPETKSHRYPLQVIIDRNPLGAAWLERVANEINC